MWIKLDLNGIDFHFQISGYRDSNHGNWDDRWCTIHITIQCPNWLDYRISSDILLSCEVEEIRDSIENLLQDRLTEQKTLDFIEPDLTILLNPKIDLTTTGKYEYIAPGHELKDCDANLQVYLWNGWPTENYFSLCFDRSDLEKLLVYLRFVTGQIPLQSAEVQELLARDIMR